MTDEDVKALAITIIGDVDYDIEKEICIQLEEEGYNDIHDTIVYRLEQFKEQILRGE